MPPTTFGIITQFSGLQNPGTCGWRTIVRKGLSTADPGSGHNHSEGFRHEEGPAKAHRKGRVRARREGAFRKDHRLQMTLKSQNLQVSASAHCRNGVDGS